MRLLIAPFILAAMLVQAPVSAQGNANQESAEKIANAIGERFPDADIDVSYKGGQVWLKGDADSQDQRKKIVEYVSNIPGVKVTGVNDEVQVIAPKKAAGVPANPPVLAARPAASATTAPVPMPNPKAAAPAPMITANVKQAPLPQAPLPQAQSPQTAAGAAMAPYPQQYYAPAYGLKPGQPSVVPNPYAPPQYAMPAQMQQQPAPQYAQQYQQQQPAYYGPPAQAAYHPEAYGPQGPLPGQYNQPNLPDYAWPAYANYPNYAQVSYPRNYSPKAWPYIGPFYPYPQVPMGWRKVTLEHHNGGWWLDFDDGTPSGPFSGLFRQSQQYTY
jgi:hypothetical protein